MNLKIFIEREIDENNPAHKSLAGLANAIDVSQETINDILVGSIPKDSKTIEKIVNYFNQDNSQYFSNNNQLNSVNTEEYKINHDRYTRLLEYCTYLYEEEKDRRNILNNTSKIYIAAQLFILTIFGSKVIGADKIDTFFDSLKSYTNGSPFIGSIIIIIFCISVASFLASFVLAVLVNKMWDRERLNNPETVLYSIGQFSTENMLIAKMTADYAVASNRNHQINDSKASLLKHSLFSFMASIFFLVVGFIGMMISLN